MRGYKFSEAGQDFDTSGSQLANFTAGVGFRLGALQIDYAFAPYGELGATHRAGVMWKFGYRASIVEREQLIDGIPRFSPSEQGVVFRLNPGEEFKNEVVRKWVIDIVDKDGVIVRSLAGRGTPPATVAWNMKDNYGNPVNLNQPFSYRVEMRERDGRAAATEGYIAQEIKPKDMLNSRPSFDTGSGMLVFNPKTSISADVREWKLNIRAGDGRIIKTMTGRGAIPKNLVWQPDKKDMGSKLGRARNVAHSI